MGNWRGSIRTKKEEFYVHVFICVWNGEKIGYNSLNPQNHERDSLYIKI
jgi:hypothetical protein